MIDLHTHTKKSIDGKSTMDDYIKHILSFRDGTSRVPDAICFTEHLDFNQSDMGYNFYDAEAFFDEFYSVKDRYAEYEADGSLLILSGIEFGEPHMYPRELERYQKLPYDMIMGSVHFFWGDTFLSEMVRDNYPVEEAFTRYYNEVYKAVSAGGFDVLGHFDFPKRYFKAEYYEPDVIRDICRKMLENNIIPEINTSSLRHDMDEPLPSLAILDIYEEVGGKSVTIGADAHRADQYALFNELALSLIKGRFDNVCFVGRTPQSADRFVMC